MRKYQQLLLLITSCLSVGVLFMYKTENKRLKDVLHIINFFGRNDAAILSKIDNATLKYLVDYSYPLAVWQAIGDHYHAYAAFWKRNELVAGGEAVVIVVGLKQAILNFKCSLNFKGSSTNIQGKFRFQRMDKNGDDDNSEFTRYTFYCRVSRDFGRPVSVVLYDLTSKGKDGHYLKLRHIRVLNENSRRLPVQPITLCVDMASIECQNMAAEEEQSSELMQFFIHHFVLGIEDFIIYNGERIPQNLIPLLHRMNIRLHLIPFNFPFSERNSTERVRAIIESDCLLRSTNRARHCLLLSPNEFFFPYSKFNEERTIIRDLNHYAKLVNHFELAVFAVCKSEKHKYIFENTLYDPEVKSPHSLAIYRPIDTGALLSSEDLSKTPTRMSLPLTQAFTLRYINCIHVGKDGLHDWRNSLRENFMQFVQRLNAEIKILIGISTF